MRVILTGCLGVGLGWVTASAAQEPAWRPTPQPTVTLGPPTVALGAPRAMTAPGGANIAPCTYGVVARGKADDKAPLPPGPALPAAPAPAAGTSPLPAPTPLTPAMPAPSSTVIGGQVFSGPVISGPVTSGPFVGDAMPGATIPGTGCATCGPTDPNWAPLPGGVFTQEAHPCGWIFYGSAEYLYWWVRDSTLPALLTVSPNNVAGAVAPNTQVAYGNESIVQQDRSGARFTAGMWFDPCRNWGVVGSYFFLATRTNDFALASDGNTVLARPFFNINGAVGGTPANPVADREIIARPGQANGMFSASSSNTLWGADLNARRNLWNSCDCRARLDALAGFRYMHFDESITLNESFQGTAGANAGRSGVLTDNFSVTNNFYGGQVGLIGELKRGCWSLDTTAKVALGTVHQTLDASGMQMGTNEFGQMVTGPGLLVQASNAGSRSRDTFAVLPEVGMNLGYQVTNHMKLFVGYDFLYCSNILRAADQIDTTLDVNSRVFPITQAPGATRPAVKFQDTGFWAQGVSAGVEFKW
jgi:hypothetical protein